MREVIALKELLSKIETLAEAALYLDAQDEKVLQTELITLISELAGNSASPVHGGEHA